MAQQFTRSDRVAEAIQKELAQIIAREFEIHELGLLTLSYVKVSRDFAQAKIYFTVLQEEKKAVALEQLNEGAAHFRHLLSKRLSTRTVPKLKFFYDEALERAQKVNQLIETAIQKDKDEDSSS